MTEKEQKVFSYFAYAGLVVTIISCWVAHQLGMVAPLEVVGALMSYASLYSMSWVLLQRPDQVVYMERMDIIEHKQLALLEA